MWIIRGWWRIGPESDLIHRGDRGKVWVGGEGWKGIKQQNGRQEWISVKQRETKRWKTDFKNNKRCLVRVLLGLYDNWAKYLMSVGVWGELVTQHNTHVLLHLLPLGVAQVDYCLHYQFSLPGTSFPIYPGLGLTPPGGSVSIGFHRCIPKLCTCTLRAVKQPLLGQRQLIHFNVSNVKVEG